MKKIEPFSSSKMKKKIQQNLRISFHKFLKETDQWEKDFSGYQSFSSCFALELNGEERRNLNTVEF